MAYIGGQFKGIVNLGGGGASLTVDFTADDTNPAPDQLVTFTATGDVGSGYIHIWDFGDGSEYDVVEDSAVATHTYTVEATVTPRLWVIQDAAGYPYGFKERTDYITVESTYTPILDDLTATPDFAWSIWQLSSLVTNCVRIRRSSDNAEQDIGFTADGYIDFASINTFIGAGSGFAVTFYDASGNGNNATESTTSRQLVYNQTAGVDGQVAFVSPIDIETKHALNSSISFPSAHNSFVVTNTDADPNLSYFMPTTTRNRGWLLWNNGDTILSWPGSNLYSSGTNISGSTDYMLETRWSGTAYTWLINNTTSASSPVSSTQTAAMTNLLGTTDDALSLCEMLVFTSVIGSTDRSAYIASYNVRFNKAI